MSALPSSTPFCDVAIIGSGIAGLSTGFLLSKADSLLPPESSSKETGRIHYRVHVFERCPILGLDSHAVDVERPYKQHPSSTAWTGRVDMPLRVFSDSYYHHLTELYAWAGVGFEREDYCGTFCQVSLHEMRDQLQRSPKISQGNEGETVTVDSFDATNYISEPYFRYFNIFIGRWSIPIPCIIPIPYSSYLPSAWSLGNIASSVSRILLIPFSILRCPFSTISSCFKVIKLGIRRSFGCISTAQISLAYPLFMWRSSRDLHSGALCGQSMRAYVASLWWLPNSFVHGFLIPTVAAMLTCSYSSVFDCPADIVIHYLTSRSLLGVCRAAKGTEFIAGRLSASFDSVTLGCTTLLVRPIVIDGTVKVIVEDDKGARRMFNHVVIATQAYVAADILDAGVREMEHELLPQGSRSDGAELSALGEALKGSKTLQQALRDDDDDDDDDESDSDDHDSIESPLPSLAQLIAEGRQRITTLRRFCYERSHMYLHCDPTLMPPREHDWGAVNFLVSTTSRSPDAAKGVIRDPACNCTACTKSCVNDGNDSNVSSSSHPVRQHRVTLDDASLTTIWMNKAQSSLCQVDNIFQTWHPTITPAPHTIFASGDFDRPVVNEDAVLGLKELWGDCVDGGAGEADAMDRNCGLQGGGNIWVCGSYAAYGMPLLENGVRSGLEVAERITKGQVRRPWSRHPRANKETLLQLGGVRRQEQTSGGGSLVCVAVVVAAVVAAVAWLRRGNKPAIG